MRGNIVYTRHGAHPYKSAYWRLLHKWVHRYVDHLTFVSQEACEIHRRTYHASGVPHHVLEFGVPLPPGAVSSRAADTASVRIGSVGRLVEVKGQGHIIEAMAALPADRALELHFYGDGPERELLQARASARIPGKVFFHGDVIDRQQIYEAIDILVVASRMEGLSLAVMEAMARGIVVVATDVGGNSRLINDGKTGLLVPYGDPRAIADAVLTLSGDPGLRTRLASAARAHITTHFSLETSAARLVSLYGFD
jgi:glycosyltransferase involved in cell wall biosynthesis